MTKTEIDRLGFILLLAACVCSGNSADAQSALSPTQQILDLLTQLREPTLSSPGPEEDAQRLAETVRSTNASLLDDQTIDSIASLLDDKDDMVRFNAAKALRYIGPKAKRAIPQLEAALRRIRLELGTKFWTGISSEDEICPALQRITGRQVGPGCDFSYRIDDE